MKTRKSYIFFIIVSILMLVVACEQAPKTQKFDDYISFTTSYMRTYDSEKDYAEYGATVYEYNLQSKKIAEIFSFPYNTGYALGVYDKRTNSVYYTKQKNNNSSKMQKGLGNQIYVHNLETGTEKMLTEELGAVNYIVPIDDTLFFIATNNTTSNLVLGKVDISDGNVKYWDEPKTSSTRLIGVDKTSKRIYVAIYDYEEEDRIQADEHKKTPNYTIYSFDYNLSDKQEVLHKDDVAIKALYVMDNCLLYRADDTMAPTPETTTISELIDLSDMKVLFKSDEQFPEMGALTRDKKGIYTLGHTDGVAKIYYFDFETEKYTPLVKNDFGSVSNFQLMYQD